MDLLDTATINTLLDGWDRAMLSGIRYRIVDAHGVPLRALLMTGVAVTLTGSADKVRRRRPCRILHSRPPTSHPRAVAIAAGVLAFTTLAWLATGSVYGRPLPSQATGGRTPPASSWVRPPCADAYRALTGTGDGLTATLTDLDSPATLRLVAGALRRGPTGRPHRDVRT